MGRRTTCILCVIAAFLMTFSFVVVIGTEKNGVSNKNVVYLSGTPREMGLQYGLSLHKEIRANLENFWAAVEAQGLSKSDLMKAAEERQISSDMTEELKAMAQTAGVDCSELVAFNVFGSSVIGGACSCFVARGDVTSDGNPLSFKTMDWYGLGGGVIEALVIVKPSTGNSYMGVTVAGGVGLSSQGINDKGLAIGYNWLPVPEYYDLGLGPWEMQEMVLEKCSSVNDAIDLVYTLPKHEGVNLMVSDRDESAFIETAPSIYSPNVSYKIVTSGFDVHTNHWLYEPFYSWILDDGWTTIWTASVCRYDRAVELGTEYQGSLTASNLMAFTRDLENWGCSPQKALADHPEWASVLAPGWPGNSICNAMTRSACVFEIDGASPDILSTMWMADGNPCYTPYVPLHTALLYSEETASYAWAHLTPYLGKKVYQLTGDLKDKYDWGELVPEYVAWEVGAVSDTTTNEAQAVQLIQGGMYVDAADLLTVADCGIALDGFGLQMQLTGHQH